MKNNNNILKILSVATLVILSSCTVYREYPIEVYQPGEIGLQPDVKTIALAYRNFKYKSDTLLHYFQSDFKLRRAKNDPKNLDSSLVAICLNEFARHLKTNTKIEKTEIIRLNTFKPHRGSNIPALSKDFIQKIAEPSGADVLIMLDTWSSFFSEYPGSAEQVKSNEVISAAVWSVYNLKTNKLIERKSMIDTLFWNGYNSEGEFDRNQKLPDRKSALQIAAKLAGETYAKRFHASWRTVNRSYSIPPLPDFALAAEYLENQKPAEAIELWKKYVNGRNRKLAIIACYNVALGYELTDDLDSAIEYLNIAMKLAVKNNSKEDIKAIISYKTILEKRKSDIKRLNKN
jgi:hypothetical protein